MSNGPAPPGTAEKSIADIVGELSKKVSLLVREEIELAKAEMRLKVSRLIRGAVAAAVAGVFALFALVLVFHAIAWLFADILGGGGQFEIWLGFLIGAGLLLVLGAVAGLLALRFFRRATPPTPELAIEEAKRTRAAIEEAKS